MSLTTEKFSKRLAEHLEITVLKLVFRKIAAAARIDIAPALEINQPLDIKAEEVKPEKVELKKLSTQTSKLRNSTSIISPDGGLLRNEQDTIIEQPKDETQLLSTESKVLKKFMGKSLVPYSIIEPGCITHPIAIHLGVPLQTSRTG
jgi:hypothetical protein